MRIARVLASLVLSIASCGASLLVAAFLLSATGNQQGAAMAFLPAMLLLALFGLPGLAIGLRRARSAEIAAVAKHITRCGAPLYERYVALHHPRMGEEGAANWRREVARLRRSLKPRPFLLRGEGFYRVVTELLAAQRRSAGQWGGAAPDTAVSIALPRQLEAELRALGWTAKTETGPGLIGPVVLAHRAGVRIVLRCERNTLTRERLARARPLQQLYRADLAGVVCAGPVEDEARAMAAGAGLMLLAPGKLKAMYPRARKIWQARTAKRQALAAGVSARLRPVRS